MQKAYTVPQNRLIICTECNLTNKWISDLNKGQYVWLWHAHTAPDFLLLPCPVLPVLRHSPPSHSYLSKNPLTCTSILHHPRGPGLPHSFLFLMQILPSLFVVLSISAYTHIFLHLLSLPSHTFPWPLLTHTHTHTFNGNMTLLEKTERDEVLYTILWLRRSVVLESLAANWLCLRSHRQCCLFSIHTRWLLIISLHRFAHIYIYYKL